jgi:TonB family protein
MSIRGCILLLSLFAVSASATVVARADECPVRVTSVNLEGKGIANRIYRYRVVLSAQSATILPDVGLQIHIGPNRSPVHVDAANVKMLLDDAGYKGVIILQRPAADVSGAAVVDTRSGNDVAPCTSPALAADDHSAALIGWEIPTVIVTLDDSKYAHPDTANTVVLSGATSHWEYKKLAALDYPPVARDSNVTGRAIVRLNIGRLGQPEDAHISVSSGSKLLDDAALSTANHSTYVGGTDDGIPITAADATYEFAIDDELTGAGRIPVTPSELLKTYCPAVLDRISLATSLLSGSAYWYDIGLLTTSTGFDSIALAVVGAHSPVKVLDWRTAVSGFNSRLIGNGDVTFDYSVADGALFWPGDALAAGTVQDATIHSERVKTCKPHGAHVDYDVDKDSIVAVAETDRPWLGTPVLETVLPARFENIVWPSYAPATTDPAAADAINVRVHVTQSGQPLAAIVSNVSSAPEFAKAALAAAMASTYVVPHTADGAPLTQTFDIVYVYVPAK